jgi:hypothetical protein
VLVERDEDKRVAMAGALYSMLRRACASENILTGDHRTGVTEDELALVAIVAIYRNQPTPGLS